MDLHVLGTSRLPLIFAVLFLPQLALHWPSGRGHRTGRILQGIGCRRFRQVPRHQRTMSAATHHQRAVYKPHTFRRWRSLTGKCFCHLHVLNRVLSNTQENYIFEHYVIYFSIAWLFKAWWWVVEWVDCWNYMNHIFISSFMVWSSFNHVHFQPYFYYNFPSYFILEYWHKQ